MKDIDMKEKNVFQIVNKVSAKLGEDYVFLMKKRGESYHFVWKKDNFSFAWREEDWDTDYVEFYDKNKLKPQLIKITEL